VLMIRSHHIVWIEVHKIENSGSVIYGTINLLVIQ
jgi:hypothetical protein